MAGTETETKTETEIHDFWDVDRANELRNRTWWWWWWIFFFDNPENPSQPKQLMTLWGTRNCKKVQIGDHVWNHKDMTVKERPDGLDFEGMAAAWYYDGKKMHEPFYIHDGPSSIDKKGEGKESWGSISLNTKEFSSRFSGTIQGYDIEITDKEEGVGMSIKLEPWNDRITSTVPTGKKYLSNLAYQMYKIRGMKASGTIHLKDRDDKVSGTAYFQNVRINAPTSPWYWATFHTEDSSYFDYFMPHMGLPALRRSYSHKSILDKGIKMLSKGFHYYDYPEDEHIKIKKKLKMGVEYDKHDMPLFHLKGEDEARTIDLKMRAYSRACWKIKQPLLGVASTTLFYNEYPAQLIDFKLKTPERTIRLEDLGRTAGNCEHAWGIV